MSGFAQGKEFAIFKGMPVQVNSSPARWKRTYQGELVGGERSPGKETGGDHARKARLRFERASVQQIVWSTKTGEADRKRGRSGREFFTPKPIERKGHISR